MTTTDLGNINPAYVHWTDDEVLDEIERYQTIQKQRSPRSDLWQDCSMALAELFEEMSRRCPYSAVRRY